MADDESVTQSLQAVEGIGQVAILGAGLYLLWRVVRAVEDVGRDIPNLGGGLPAVSEVADAVEIPDETYSYEGFGETIEIDQGTDAPIGNQANAALQTGWIIRRGGRGGGDGGAGQQAESARQTGKLLEDLITGPIL